MNKVVLTPGSVPLADWRHIYEGATPQLAADTWNTVRAGAEAIARIVERGEPVYGVNTGFGKLASVRIEQQDLAELQRNIVLSHAAGTGTPVPPHIARLMMALKLANISQGHSGVQVATVELLQAMLEAGITSVIPGQGSVGASGDLAPLSHLACALIGVGECDTPAGRLDAKDALAAANLEPVELGPKEGLALLNGTQFSTAYAMAALFETQRLFNTALVTGALSTEAAKGSDTPFDARIHEVRKHQGQIDAAASLRSLMASSAIRESHREGDERVQDPYCLRCQPQVMGAALDLIRNVARTLETEANGVTDNPLVFDDIALSGGNFHAEPVAFAADILALAICEIGSIAERRIAMLIDPALSGLPAFLTPNPGLNSGFMIPQVTAAALVSENKQRAMPASVDSIPTSANQEDHVSMAAHGSRRLQDMLRNAEAVLGIELLVAAQGCDFHAPLTSSEVLESVRKELRLSVPFMEDDRLMVTDMDAANELVRSGSVANLAAEHVIYF